MYKSILLSNNVFDRTVRL